MDKILKHKRELKVLSEKLSAIVDAEGDRTSEEITESNAILDQIDELSAKIETLERAEKTRASLSDNVETTAVDDSEVRSPKIESVQPEPFKSLGEWMQAIAAEDMPPDLRLGGATVANWRRRFRELRAGTPSGSSEAIPSEGGFLVKTDQSSEVLKRVHEAGILANRCRRLQISSDANTIKIPGVDESSRADGSRFGGVRGYWVDEADQVTSSKPKFRLIQLTLNKLAALYYATDEVLQDAALLESLASDAFVQEMAFKLDDAIYNGDGSGKPLGVLNANALVSVTKETGQAATTIEYENIAKMYSRLWARSRSNAVWYANQDIIPQILTMSLAVGTGGVPVYLPANGAAGRPFDTLMGLPIIFNEFSATLGTVGDIALLDLSQYFIAEKGGIQTAQSIHLRFDYNEQVFRWVYRIDGQPAWNTALTPFKGTNTQSPYIVVATRS